MLKIQYKKWAIRILRQRLYHFLLCHKLITPFFSPDADDFPRIIESQDKTPAVCRIPVRITVRITEQDIDDIMFMALTRGVSYWCSNVKVMGLPFGNYPSEQISRSGILWLYDISKVINSDCEEELKAITGYMLTREKFIKGLYLYIHRHGISFDENHRINPYDINPVAADRIIQYALFDHIVYS